jgi:hypothetical protein
MPATKMHWWAAAVIGLTLAAGMALGACADRGSSTQPLGVAVGPSPAPLPIVGALRGTIDLTTGALQFENAALPAVSAGVSRAVYGDQNVLVRLYNTAVAVDSTTTPGTKTWTGNFGLRNLTNHVIGDEQAGTAPDTMGVFVFFNTTPTITGTSAPCTGCTVTINRADGTGNFTAAGQLYFWWRDRVAANDTTKTRKLWSFSAPSAVRSFSFTVLVSAAWPPPDETRWKVVLNNDSLPDTQEEPRWRLERDRLVEHVLGVGRHPRRHRRQHRHAAVLSARFGGSNGIGVYRGADAVGEREPESARSTHGHR